MMYGGKKPAQTNTASTEQTATTSTAKKKKTVTVGGITFETDADNPSTITLEQVPAGQLPKPVPTLSDAVTFSATANVSPDAQKIIRTQITDLVKKLTANPGDFNSWLSIGLYRKMAGDYTKARDMWEYAKKLQPTDKQAYNNLGDLYQYYLKDSAQAELNWKKTVELDPKFIAGYRSLYDLYTQNKQNDKAKAILDVGLQKNPRSIDLLVLTAQFYKNIGQKDVAKTFYEKALVEAKAIPEDASMIPSIQAEIDAL